MNLWGVGNLKYAVQSGFSKFSHISSDLPRSHDKMGGGGPTTKKIMPPGKTQDVLSLFCSFLFFFKTR